ncbi:hypothetical protein B484DRAFT_109322 [Ochromonadaceae sp. CCMP2298]|nr:hypothetical protein B484DRAFT_109322 [Ochromonadaceae sp. CCMP2298]
MSYLCPRSEPPAPPHRSRPCVLAPPQPQVVLCLGLFRVRTAIRTWCMWRCGTGVCVYRVSGDKEPGDSKWQQEVNGMVLSLLRTCAGSSHGRIGHPPNPTNLWRGLADE